MTAPQMPLGSRVAAKVALAEVRLTEVRLELRGLDEPTEVILDVRHRTGWARRDDRLIAEVDVWAALVPTGDGDEPVDEAEPIFEVTAEHRLGYRLAADFQATDEEYLAFVNSSAVLMAWPYVREVIQSLAAKAGYAQVVLPTFKVTLDGLAADETVPPSADKPPVKQGAAKKPPGNRAVARKAASRKAVASKKAVALKKASEKPMTRGSRKH